MKLVSAKSTRGAHATRPKARLRTRMSHSAHSTSWRPRKANLIPFTLSPIFFLSGSHPSFNRPREKKHMRGSVCVCAALRLARRTRKWNQCLCAYGSGCSGQTRQHAAHLRATRSHARKLGAKDPRTSFAVPSSRLARSSAAAAYRQASEQDVTKMWWC